jgi:hypothetical protein
MLIMGVSPEKMRSQIRFESGVGVRCRGAAQARVKMGNRVGEQG